MPDLTTAAAVSTAVGAAVSTWPGLLALVFVYLAPHVVTYVQARRTKALAARAADDAAQTREQTVNNHQDHPTPNMREQMDAQDERQARIEAGVEQLVAAFDEHITSDTAWKSALEHDLSRRHRPFLSWRF